MADNKVAQLKKELDVLLSSPELVEKVMTTLDDLRIVHYQEGSETPLFSTAGRVLYSLMLDPYMTQRALAVYLQLSETMIEKTIKSLLEDGLITKTKVNRKNVYTFDINLLLKHPDIQRIPPILKEVNRLRSQQVDDEPLF
jgi:DNA-binding transcriptional regulator GbsR (MarR family)